jgi:chromosome segregation ATPase
MIEPIMYAAIGFLISMLCGLMILPLVHNRAVRLTTRRMEAATPLSMAEIQADKDQLRAEFAMSARRLEMSVDQLKSKTTSQLAELGKKTDAINRMKIELGEKNAAIFALEAREKAMKEQLHATEEEFTAKTELLRNAEQALTDKQSELGKINAALNDRSMTADSRQIELVAVRTQVEELKTRVGDAAKEFAATEARLTHERNQSETATRDLTDARGRVENLSQRVTDLDRQLIAQVKEAEMLGNRVTDLETRLATQGKLLAEREFENGELKQANAAAERTVQELREEIAAAGGGKSSVLEKLRQEKAAVEEQLHVARDERGKLQRDINAIQQQAASASMTSPPRWPSSRSSSRARIRRSRPCWRPSRPCHRRPPPSPRAAPQTAPPRRAAGCRNPAGRWPNASGRCNRMPPAPVSRALDLPRGSIPDS